MPIVAVERIFPMKIYALPLADTGWGDAEHALLPHVSAHRQEKIKKFHAASDKKLALYAALTARMALSLALCLPADRLTFDAAAHGKPTLSCAPETGFSVSHTKNFVLCAVSEHGAVGADAERVRNAPAAVMRRAFCEAEIRYVSTPAFSDERFFEIWTKKEAYTKFLGTGLAVELISINTLAPALACHFYTFSCENCICAVYGTDAPDGALCLLSEKEILDFFTL